MIRPLSSAISTKRAGDTSPCSSSRQRSSASAPAMRPSCRLNLGWNSMCSISSRTARRSRASSASQSRRRLLITALYDHHPSAPSALDWYIAVSACLSTVATSAPSSGIHGHADAGCAVELQRIEGDGLREHGAAGSGHRQARRRAHPRAPTTTTNSSPPRRDTSSCTPRVSKPRTASARRCATVRSTVSPTEWPKVSFTRLKLFRSM